MTLTVRNVSLILLLIFGYSESRRKSGFIHGQRKDYNIWDDSLDLEEPELDTNQIRTMAMTDMKIESIPDSSKDEILIPPIMYQLYDQMHSAQCSDQLIIKLTPYDFKPMGDQCFVEFDIPRKSNVGQLITNIHHAELRIQFTKRTATHENILVKFNDVFILDHRIEDESYLNPVYNGSNLLLDYVDEGIENEITWNITRVAQYSHVNRTPMTFVASIQHPPDIEPYPHIKNVYVIIYQRTKVQCRERTITSHGASLKRVQRRHAHDSTTTNKGKRYCRRKALYVDFEEIGWSNWIVSPDGYRANYCVGKCPFSATGQLNGTNHAIIQSLVNTHRPKIPPAKCVPTKLSGITMLYLDHDNNVVLRQYSEMVVQSCGCK